MSNTTTHSCDASQIGAQMTYDNEGRLETWTALSGTTASDQFLYDNVGQRVLQRTSNAGTVSHTISFDGYTDVTISGGTTSTTRYYSAGGQRVAMRQDGTFSYLLPDFLGSNSIALRADGSVQAVQLFSPFGATRYSDGTMLSPFNFTGQRLDAQTGLLYYNARYYDAVSGRFTSADTVATNGNGQDAYAYVDGNPESFTDPTGLFREGNNGEKSWTNPIGNKATYVDSDYNPSPAPIIIGYGWGASWTPTYGPYLPVTAPAPKQRVKNTVNACNDACKKHHWDDETLHRLQEATTIYDGLTFFEPPDGADIPNELSMRAELETEVQEEEAVQGEEEALSSPLYDSEEPNTPAQAKVRGLRKDILNDWSDYGVDVNGQTLKLNDHAYKSLMKSGRKDISPRDMIAALQNEPTWGEYFSQVYVNPATGTKVYVNPATDEIVGVQPGTFK